MTTASPLTRQLHDEYCRLIGDPAFPYTLMRELAWDHWVHSGHCMADLKLVLNHLNHGIKNGQRYPGCLRFSSLIESPGRFDEELSLARAEQRNIPPKQTIKDRWISKPVDTAHHIAQCLPSPERIAELAKAAHQAADAPQP